MTGNRLHGGPIPAAGRRGAARQHCPTRAARSCDHKHHATRTTSTTPGWPVLRQTGAASPAASVVYLTDSSTSRDCWRPVAERLHRLLDGRIAQITCEAAASADLGGVPALTGEQEGPIVLVAHCTAALPILRHAQSSGPSPLTAAGIVLLNPLFDAAPTGTTIGSGAGEPSALALRELPTWTVTGQHDPYSPPERCRRFAESIWGDHDVVPRAGHLLPLEDPHAASAPILTALETAYRAERTGAGPC